MTDPTRLTIFSRRQSCTFKCSPMRVCSHNMNSNQTVPLPVQPFDERSISVCIPAIASDLDENVPRLLQSLVAQTLQPKEVVLVISHLADSDCDGVRSQLGVQYPRLHLLVHCESKLQNQAWARNAAATLSTGTTVSFIDADDVMAPQKLRRVADMFRRFAPVLVLHGCAGLPGSNCDFSVSDFACAANSSASGCSSSSAKPRGPLPHVLHGSAFTEQAIRTRFYRLHVFDGVANSQPTVRAEAIRGSNATWFRDTSDCQRLEDSYFIRDVLTTYGRRDSSVCYLNEPLAWYVPRRYQHAIPRNHTNHTRHGANQGPEWMRTLGDIVPARRMR